MTVHFTPEVKIPEDDKGVEEKENKSSMPVVKNSKTPEPLAHAARTVADAVAEATNTARRYITKKH